jgi:hypothetical protein
MSFDPLEPQYTDEELAANLAHQHEVLANAGGTFNGEGWLLLMETFEPLSEITLACAVDPDAVENSKGRPTMFSVALAETPYGYVMIISITLYDQVDSRWRAHVLFNPISPDSRKMLRKLAKQETVQICFYDKDDGSGIGRRVLRMDPETNQAIRQTLNTTRAANTTPERWGNLVAFMRERGY